MNMFNILTVVLTLLLLQDAKYQVSSELCSKSLCEYQFVVRETRSMMFTTNNSHGEKRSFPVIISRNGSLSVIPTTFNRQIPDVNVPIDEVHTLDGHARTFITINDQFPGPAIEVMKGAQVVVNVVNELLEDSLTIHWHGMHMRNNPWMDGTAYVSQCPIRSKESFQYRFIASPVGTHWYHSHFKGQRADGLFGPLIVHRSKPSIPYMTMMINDWHSMPSAELLLRNPFHLPRGGIGDIYDALDTKTFIFDGTETTPLRYWSGLINGRGRHDNNTAPLSTFTVKAGQKYRIHLVFSSIEYNYRFSIDQHQLKVVEADGYPVKPVNVESLLGFMGERFVVEFTANQNVTKYWIRATTVRTGLTKQPQPDGKRIETLAILQYEGAVGGEPETSPRNCTEVQPCLVLNCPWPRYHKEWYPHHKCIPISDLRLHAHVYDGEQDKNVKNDEVFEIFLNFGFPIGSSINKLKNVNPRAPLFQNSTTWGITPCASDCIDKGCRCTHLINIPFNRTVQMVLTSNSMLNTDKNGMINDITTMHHPVHVHGHSFQVLKVGFPISDSETGRIEKQNQDLICENDACSKQRWADGEPKGLNFDNPPIKDTVIVPASGYVVIRFKSDNPGYWFLHCHQELHNFEGMALTLNESHAKLPPPPANFPTCEDFSMTSHEFDLMLERNKQCLSEECGDKKGNTSQAPLLKNEFAWTCLLVTAFLAIQLSS